MTRLWRRETVGQAQIRLSRRESSLRFRRNREDSRLSRESYDRRFRRK